MFVKPLDAVKLGLIYQVGDKQGLIKSLPENLKKKAKDIEKRGEAMREVLKRDAEYMNLIVSYGPKEDEFLKHKGFKFLGACKDKNGKEMHVFQKESLGKFKKRMKKVETASKKSHPDIKK